MSVSDSQSATTRDSPRAGFAYIVASAILLSLIPLIIDISGSTTRPLMVGAGIVFGFLVFSGFLRPLLPGANKSELSTRRLLERYKSQKVSALSILLPIIATGIAGLSYATFSWSTAYIDTAAASSLFELWPMTWFIAIRLVDSRRHGPHTERYTSWTTYFLMFLGVLAIGLVVYSTRSADGSASTGSFSLQGIALGTLSPIIGALSAFNFLFIDRLIHGRSKSPNDDWDLMRSNGLDEHEVEEYLSLTGILVARCLILPVVLILAWQESMQGNWSIGPFLGGVAAGLILHGPGDFLIRRAHLVTHRRELIVLQYLTPIFALLWLGVFRGIDIGRIDFLILGTVIIVAINMLVNVDPETVALGHITSTEQDPVGPLSVMQSTSRASKRTDAGAHALQERYSLKALVVSLLGFGTFIYFRHEFIASEVLSWVPGDYWAILGLASTVFALLLAFRLTRVESVLLAEDYRTFGLVRSVEMLPSRLFDEDSSSGSKEYLSFWIRQLNRSGDVVEYREAYNRLQVVLQEMTERSLEESRNFDHDVVRDIASIRTEIDTLAHGRQHAREFAERIALWLIGIMIAVLAMAVPAQPGSVAQLLVEIFAILLASVVVFLLFHLADIRRSRADEVLMRRPSSWTGLPDGLYVRFRDRGEIFWQRLFSGMIILGVIGAIAGLIAWDRL